MQRVKRRERKARQREREERQMEKERLLHLERLRMLSEMEEKIRQIGKRIPGLPIDLFGKADEPI